VKNFVLIGAAGYIAPRHMQAIKETGNNLIAAFDPHDSVGILDSYFPNCDFFTEFERFDRHCDKLKRQGTSIDYVVVCSPNYLHDAHIRFGLRIGADVICEKPVVLNPWNVDALMEMEKETGKRVYVIHQLRYHPEIIALKEKVSNAAPDEKFNLSLKYITPRGKWYQYSWKGDEAKSGGILSNIGLHFFDMLLWIFGDVEDISVNKQSTTAVSGAFIFKNANVNWHLSVAPNDLAEKGSALRCLTINDEEIDFSHGFDQLHTHCYKSIINQQGIGLNEAKKVTNLIAAIKSAV
jgi:UDP-N-acetyl-2-amino-2-deoxyglucuronate dehydrogenase